MQIFEFFVVKPVKVTIQANTMEEAQNIARQQLGLKPADPVDFIVPIEQEPITNA